MELERFLRCLFGEAPGFIEVRLIEDKKLGKVIKREWYRAVEDLLAGLPALRLLADQHKAAVFFGVLRRRERGKGKAADVVAGLVAWADIDFKDYSGGEAEARKRLAEFSIQPSIVVRSAHGLHAYWLMREATDPEKLSGISRGIAQVLGGDHAFDAARILRIPGTNNWKDPEHPIAVEIEILDSTRVYTPTEIEEVLSKFGTRPGDDAKHADQPHGGHTRIARPLYPLILELLGNKQLRALFDGTGKPELRDDGKPMDRTSSGYDYSIVLALRRKGVKDPDQLGNVLWNRPDGVAREKGLDYILRTVEAVLKRLGEFEAEREEEDVAPDFVVERFRVFSSVPPVYELTIAGKRFTLKTPQLLSRDAFTVAFVNMHRRVPALPKRWTDQVNAWLAEAEVVEQPPEASDEHALREAMQRVINDMPVSEEAGDLDHGKAVSLEDGDKAFKADAVLKLMLEDWKGLPRNDLCRV